MTEIDIGERARKLYADALVWDTHSGFMPDPAADLDNLQIWRDAGVNYLSIDVGFDLMPWQDTVKTLAAFRRWINARPDGYTLVTSADEALQAKADGKLGITFDIEGMNALDGRIEMVELYHNLGVRQMLFAYNRNTLAGGGCHDDDTGLTAFGRQVIDEMNRLGMFVDVTHCGHRTSMEVMEYSNRPVIFSHSNPRALSNHGRNILDDQIRACARTGGVVGIVGINLFLGDDNASSETLANHVDYLLEVAGPGHVGIGLDFAFPVHMEGIDQILVANPQFWPKSEGYGAKPTVYAQPAQLAEMTELLLRRGHDDDTVRGVLGGNFLRLAREIWK